MPISTELEDALISLNNRVKALDSHEQEVVPTKSCGEMLIEASQTSPAVQGFVDMSSVAAGTMPAPLWLADPGTAVQSRAMVANNYSVSKGVDILVDWFSVAPPSLKFVRFEAVVAYGAIGDVITSSASITSTSLVRNTDSYRMFTTRFSVGIDVEPGDVLFLSAHVLRSVTGVDASDTYITGCRYEIS